MILRAAAIASGALLLAYDTPEGKIIYPGRVGTGMPVVSWSASGDASSPWLSKSCR